MIRAAESSAGPRVIAAYWFRNVRLPSGDSLRGLGFGWQGWPCRRQQARMTEVRTVVVEVPRTETTPGRRRHVATDARRPWPFRWPLAPLPATAFQPAPPQAAGLDVLA